MEPDGIDHSHTIQPGHPIRLNRRQKFPLFPDRLKPNKQFFIVAGCILVAEILNLFRVSLFPGLAGFEEVLTDSFFVVLVISLIFYFLYRPYKNHWEERLIMEKALLISEERLGLALDAANEGLWDLDLPSGKTYFSSPWADMLGYRPEEIEPHYSAWERLVHPGDRTRVMAALLGDTLQMEEEFRMLHHAGGWLWILARGKAVAVDEGGKPQRKIGTHTDITERKQADERIHHLSRQLLNLAEAERAKLARDMHDEFGQLLTRIQLGLETVRKSLPSESTVSQYQLNNLSSLVAQLGDNIHDLSTDLLPIELEDLGLFEALPAFIRKIQEENDELEIDLEIATCQRYPPPVEIALFRICQEATNNTLKHAQARHLWLALATQQRKVVLSIRDDGRGFDPGFKVGSPPTPGIGLIGMQERVASLGGEFKLQTGTGAGTEITASIPLLAENQP